MPIHKIQVSEYECVHCGYKWINRVNGKDRPMPKNCAKCKRFHWNGKGEGSGYNPITPRERSMRVKLYRYEGYRLGKERQYRPNELCKKFLDLNPRPTLRELYDALYPLGGYSSYAHRFNHYIPDPDPNRPHIAGHINLKQGYPRWIPDPNREGWLIRNPEPFDKSDYVKTFFEERRLRREFMEKVIKSRGEKVPKEKTLKQYQAEYDKIMKEMIGKIVDETLGKEKK